jgi:LPPG:FO 2-phospho-L-lactate transferase
MSDDRIETHVVIDDEGGRRAVHFQEWWLRMHAEVPAIEFAAVGADAATPAPGVLEAIEAADVIVLPPSNPVVSIGSVLAVPRVRDALRSSAAPIVGVAPIIGGAPVRGMADACLRAIGVDTNAAAVAWHYGLRSQGGLLDGWLVDEVDKGLADELAEAGLPTRAVPLLMTDVDAAAAMALATLELADAVRP